MWEVMEIDRYSDHNMAVQVKQIQVAEKWIKTPPELLFGLHVYLNYTLWVHVLRNIKSSIEGNLLNTGPLCAVVTSSLLRLAL